MYAKVLLDVFGPIIIVIIIIIYIGNTLLCVLIAIAKALRRSLKNWLILGSAVCDLLAGFVSCLLVTEIYAHVKYSCVSMIILQAYVGYAMNFLALWYMVTLNIQYLVRLTRSRTTELPPLAKVCAYASLTLMPWVAMATVIIPGATFGSMDMGQHHWQTFCSLILSPSADIALKVLSSFLPMGILIVTSVIMAVVYHASPIPVSYASMTTSLIEPDDTGRIEKPICYIVPNVLTIVCTLPIELFYFASHSVVFDYHSHVITAYSLTILCYMKSAILPFMWILMPDIRSEIKSRCHGRQETGRVTYRRFPEQHDSEEVTISHSEDE